MGVLCSTSTCPTDHGASPAHTGLNCCIPMQGHSCPYPLPSSRKPAATRKQAELQKGAQQHGQASWPCVWWHIAHVCFLSIQPWLGQVSVQKKKAGHWSTEPSMVRNCTKTLYPKSFCTLPFDSNADSSNPKVCFQIPRKPKGGISFCDTRAQFLCHGFLALPTQHHLKWQTPKRSVTNPRFLSAHCQMPDVSKWLYREETTMHKYTLYWELHLARSFLFRGQTESTKASLIATNTRI